MSMEKESSSCPSATEFPSSIKNHRNSLYQLQDGVFLVPGAKKAAICDTNTGAVYSINEVAKKIITEEVKNEQFSQQLSEMGLATGKPEIVVKEKPQFNLEFTWFEIISDDCNERCIHCYADSMPPTYRKFISEDEISLIDQPQGKEKVSAERWKKLIDETVSLGCKRAQFIGGEPFLWRGENGENVLDLAEYAKKAGYDFVEIFTNGTLLTEKDVRRIKDLGLNIAVSLYSNEESVHDEITRTPGSFKKTKRALELLQKAEVPARVETVLMRPNEGTAEETNSFIKEMGFLHRPPDVLRPKGRGDNPELVPSCETSVRYGLMLGPNFTADKEFFQRSVEGHNCLAGKITITDNGEVLPCIFSRGKIMGNVLKDESLGKILKEELSDTWETTKDDVLVCQDCEYRYVCFDCRPISEGASGGKGDYKTAPYPRCTYNPYEGKWGGGTWKLDDEGKPYYDESLEALIEEARDMQIPLVQPRGHS